MNSYAHIARIFEAVSVAVPTFANQIEDDEARVDRLTAEAEKARPLQLTLAAQADPKAVPRMVDKGLTHLTGEMADFITALPEEQRSLWLAIFVHEVIGAMEALKLAAAESLAAQAVGLVAAGGRGNVINETIRMIAERLDMESLGSGDALVQGSDLSSVLSRDLHYVHGQEALDAIGSCDCEACSDLRNRVRAGHEVAPLLDGFVLGDLKHAPMAASAE